MQKRWFHAPQARLWEGRAPGSPDPAGRGDSASSSARRRGLLNSKLSSPAAVRVAGLGHHARGVPCSGSSARVAPVRTLVHPDGSSETSLPLPPLPSPVKSPHTYVPGPAAAADPRAAVQGPRRRATPSPAARKLPRGLADPAGLDSTASCMQTCAARPRSATGVRWQEGVKGFRAQDGRRFPQE